MSAVTKADAEALKRNEAKWTKPLIDAGWNAFPSIIIEKQEALGLDPLDMNIILHLSNYWWTAENLPHPKVATIASALGVTPRAVQKRIKALEAAGFMERTERRIDQQASQTNLYSFKGLIEKVTPFALEKNVKKAAKKKENEAWLASKKPKLSLVKS